MEGVIYSLFSHWGIFLLGFVAGAFWATRPREDLDRVR